MTDREFLPRSIRSDPDATVLYSETLYEGVPGHLSHSLRDFVSGHVQSFEDVKEIERKLRKSFTRYGKQAGGGTVELQLQSVVRLMLAECSQDPDLFLDIVDERLSTLDRRYSQHEAAALSLDQELAQGGSAWTVVRADTGNGFALQRRVDRTVADAAKAALEHGKAGEHLRMAWGYVYGRHRDPSEAYDRAVKAVEAAAKPVISPSNPSATLGTMIRDLQNKPEKWAVALHGDGNVNGATVDAVTIVRLMSQLLWRSQHDRHGDDDDAKPISVSQEEAEAAVHLAALLVQWFSTGAVRRVG